MNDGVKPLIFHAIHTAIVFYCMVISIIFVPCFGLDNMHEYTCIYRHGEYTLLSYFYSFPLMFFLIMIAFFGSFHSVPYSTMYWIKYCRNPRLGNAPKGACLTAILFFMIIIHPLGTLTFIDTLNKYSVFSPEFIWAVIFIYIIVAIYYFPFAFIALSFPKPIHHLKYKRYKVFVISQLVIYLILIIYLNSPLPEALSVYIDQNYLHWLHR